MNTETEYASKFSNTKLHSQPKEIFKYILLAIRTSYEKIMQEEQTTHEAIRNSDASQVMAHACNTSNFKQDN